jgi:hypothetical protein
MKDWILTILITAVILIILGATGYFMAMYPAAAIIVILLIGLFTLVSLIRMSIKDFRP